MTLVENIIRVLHFLVGAGWVGYVLFMTTVVLPLAAKGSLNAGPLESMKGKLTVFSRASSVLMLLTGGYLAWVGYSVDEFASTMAGNLVLGMVVLWLVFTALIEVGGQKLSSGLRNKKVREPAYNSIMWYRAASIVGILLLIDGALLMG
ncbi:MAG: copper resistance protein CopD [Halobacteria archaeon]|nr:copper resistance protein CopD [Halobacteria archaeon]